MSNKTKKVSASLRKSLTKSLVEDTGEDFINIEE